VRHDQQALERLVYSLLGKLHDIKNNMNCIHGFAANINEMAVEKDLDVDDIAKFSEIILNSVRSMDTSLAEVLSLAKGEPHKTLVDLTELIRTEIDLVSAMAGEIKIIAHPKEDCLLYIDKRQIGTVIKELLHNAVYASQNSGGKEIAVKTSFYDNPEKERHSVCIEVHNRGHIPEKDLERIFQLSFTTRATGSGVGLTAARSTIEMHGGKIKCRNDGDHVVFKIYLPRNL
jgi:signal transduction histidine kinase